MCKQHNPRKIDKCMQRLIPHLAIDYITACCCGHGKYPMTIVAWDDGEETYYEVLSQINIPRKKRFYVKDKQGYYYIPETVLPTKHNSRNNQSALKKAVNELTGYDKDYPIMKKRFKGDKC